ncbi:unnamed protein product [Polarella glacialis]|uniref:Uncharacterized protein n=1 Tax=Polarella glacialis TaxID=89957 RepID=A0A813FAU4_POLGL|nr:unnamed protein product [Polarella glacialis]CAE8659758.1 unnamed protein product [Polarella glacialis]
MLRCIVNSFSVPLLCHSQASCFYGSTFNAVAFTTWTLVYTVPRWQEDVYEPIFDSPQPSVTLAWQAYTLYAVADEPSTPRSNRAALCLLVLNIVAYSMSFHFLQCRDC